MSLNSHTRDPRLKVIPGGLVLRIFTSGKIHRPHPGLNPRALDLEASTLPRDHRANSHENYTFIHSQPCVRFLQINWKGDSTGNLQLVN